MPRYRLLIEYDGTDFHGWQTQPKDITVQEKIEQALTIILRTPISIVGSGRTDAGVHAYGQVAHFDTAEALDISRTIRSLNGLLPDSISILALETAPNDFHSRFDAVRRTYSYRISTAPRAIDRRFRWVVSHELDVDRMNATASDLLGRQNFDSFCLSASATTNRVCEVMRAVWVPEARPGDFRFEIAADRFLHGMVRAIVGTLVEIGTGRRNEGSIPKILAAEARSAAGQAAPAYGLALDRVEYPTPVFGNVGTHQSGRDSNVPTRPN